jgi:hypothetical protein
MLNEFSVEEKIVKEVLIDLITERAMLMSAGIQESLTRGLQASLSTAHGDGLFLSSKKKVNQTQI